MEIIKNKIKIKLSATEKKTFDEMVVFTRKFFEQNDKCVKYSCTECPLNMFCGSEDLSRTTQNAIEQIEEFLNSEI